MENSCSVNTNFVLLEIDFLILKAVSTRLRGSREKIKSLPPKNGAVSKKNFL